MKVYTLKDIKVEVYLPPFIAENHETAERLLLDSASNESIIYKHLEDFQIYQIGEFNKDTGELSSVPHKSLGLVEDIFRKTAQHEKQAEIRT